ncbi:MAG: hypothetical protein LW862_22535 [Rubrivivax sp.]|nr:hypothetical protein [Rubrivivax sp.]
MHIGYFSLIQASMARNLAAVLAALALAGCSTVTLISDYDAETDKQLTALQQSLDGFISKMTAETPKWDKQKRSAKNAYAAQKKFYTEFDEKLRLLEFRVQSIPKNSKTEKLVSDIRTSVLLGEADEKRCEEENAGKGIVLKDGEETRLSSLQALHCLEVNKTEGPRRAALEIAQANINQVIRSALALELAKKQGGESNK